MPTQNNERLEESAGCVLVRGEAEDAVALVIRVRKEGYEIPKGHIEPGETSETAALRELREETGLRSAVTVVAKLGVLEYTFEHRGTPIRKRVSYFAVAPTGETVEFNKRPVATRELLWVSAENLKTLPLINQTLRPIIRQALTSSKI